MSIIDIRGTHGSGKSYIPHTILQNYNSQPIMEDGVEIGQFVPSLDLAVLGQYRTVCGGCDGIKTADEVVRRVQLFSSEYWNVLLEGILVAHTFKRYSELAIELSVRNYFFCFLNTPLKTCIARVQARRLEKGNTKPLNPTNVIGDWHNIWKTVRPKCVAAGHNVKVIHYQNPLEQILELLE